MKKTILTTVVAIFSMSFAFAQNGTDALPTNAQDFIDMHFGAETIDKVEEEKGWFSWDKNEMYEVHFANGIRVDFNKQGEATEISSRNGESIPQEALPQELVSYVESNYGGSEINSWERDEDKQEIELADGTELEFDLDGNFLKED